MTTAYHARYFAHELTRRQPEGVDRLSMALFDACVDLNLDDLDNDKLDQWFQTQDYSTRDLIYDLVYVNGDNDLEDLRRADETWKVRLIEEEFQRLMFDVADV